MLAYQVLGAGCMEKYIENTRNRFSELELSPEFVSILGKIRNKDFYGDKEIEFFIKNIKLHLSIVYNDLVTQLIKLKNANFLSSLPKSLFPVPTYDVNQAISLGNGMSKAAMIESLIEYIKSFKDLMASLRLEFISRELMEELDGLFKSYLRLTNLTYQGLYESNDRTNTFIELETNNFSDSLEEIQFKTP